jgi:hypothetical protein
MNAPFKVEESGWNGMASNIMPTARPEAWPTAPTQAKRPRPQPSRSLNHTANTEIDSGLSLLARWGGL